MADKKISELATATTSIGGYIPIVIGGVTKKCLTNGGAGTLDADTVSGYGIGTINDLGSGYNLDNLKTNGIYSVTSPTGTNAPNVGSQFTVVVAAYSATVASQWIHGNGGNTWIRNLSGGSWYLFQIWNAATDGNGGQPPAPKPLASYTTFSTGGTAYTMPSGGGLYKYTMYLENDATYWVSADVFVNSGNQCFLFNKIAASGNLDIAAGTGLAITGTHTAGGAVSFRNNLVRYCN